MKTADIIQHDANRKFFHLFEFVQRYPSQFFEFQFHAAMLFDQLESFVDDR